MVAENCSGGAGAAVDREEMNKEEDGEKNWGGGAETFPRNSVRARDPRVASGAYPPLTLKF